MGVWTRFFQSSNLDVLTLAGYTDRQCEFMENEALKDMIDTRVGSWLRQMRQRADLSTYSSADFLKSISSAKMVAIEEGHESIPCCDLARLVDLYRIPYFEASAFLLDLQIDVWKFKSKH